MMDALGINKYSIRRRCMVLQLRRQTYHRRKGGVRAEDGDKTIKQMLHKVSGKYLAWGFWMIFYYLRNEGFTWNHKRVYRVWRMEGLHLSRPPKRSKLRRQYLDLIAPNQINQGWAMDFLSEWVVGAEQQAVRVINVMDECSRRALWTAAHKSICAKTLIGILDNIIAWRGKPSYIRCDNGPEFISDALNAWAKLNEIELRHIQPGKPTQNGLIERLNGTLRTECLNLEWFADLETLNQKVQQWWLDYNDQRPHSAIKYKTPTQFEYKNQLLYYKAVAA